MSVKINGHPVDILMNKGAVVIIIPEYLYRKHLLQLPVKEGRKGVKKLSEDEVDLLGGLTVTVEYNAHKDELPSVIMKEDKPALFGRNWLERIKLDW